MDLYSAYSTLILYNKIMQKALLRMNQFLRLIDFKFHFETRSLANFITDKQARFILSKKSYVGDGVITQQLDPTTDLKMLKSFNDSFHLVPSKYASLRKLHFRFTLLIWAMRYTKNLEGGIVECGVWYGVLSKALMNYFRNQDLRKFYLFDSWGYADFRLEGFYKKENYLEDIFAIVKLRFLNENVELVRGTLPLSFVNNLPESIGLLMIDLNSGIVEYKVLEICWPKIPVGGVVYLDDYNLSFPEVMKSVDKFVHENNQALLVYPTGQAILIKQ
jgi:hypothetical protein